MYGVNAASALLSEASVLIFVQIVEYGRTKDFTSLIVVHTNRREPG